MTPSSITTILFIPGAWHSSEHFGPMAKILEQEGFRTELVELPSVGPSKHLDSFDPDVEVIRQCLSRIIANGQRVAIVAHSYGGIPACEALQGFVKAYKDKIAHLYLLASFILPENASLMSAFGGEPLPWFRVSADGMEVNPATPLETFYNDVPEDEARMYVQELQPQSYRVMHSPLTYAAWREVPSTYLYCTQDQAIPLEIQKMMVEETAAGVNIRTDEVDGGHGAFLTKPREVADSIARAIRSN